MSTYKKKPEIDTFMYALSSVKGFAYTYEELQEYAKKIPSSTKSSRKNTDTEVCELVLGVKLGLTVANIKNIDLDLDLSNLSNLDNLKIVAEKLVEAEILVCDNIINYIIDGKNKTLKIKQHLKQNIEFDLPSDEFNKLISNVRNKHGIIVSGKNISKEQHSELIIKAHEGLEKKDKKADIHIIFKEPLDKILPNKFNNGQSQILGISVKQTNDCTKANYSVHKLIGELGGSEVELQNIKKEYLGEDLCVNLGKKTTEEKDIIRQKAKSLLLPHTHGDKGVDPTYIPKDKSHYYDRLKHEIQETGLFDRIKDKLIGLMYSEKAPYDNYEITNTNFYKLTHTAEELETLKKNSTLEPYRDGYNLKDGELSDSAKLFYKLTIQTKGSFTVEIRHKGEFSSSPQFQIMK